MKPSLWLEQSLARGLPKASERRLVHFGLGKLYDEIREYNNAFRHYQSGNVLKPYRFQPELHEKYIDSLIAAYGSERMSHLSRGTNRSEIPVFIVGMPRSGTTLVEQILSSYPCVCGAGELSDIKNMVRRLPAMLDTTTPYPECLDSLTGAALEKLAQYYLARLRSFSRTACRITDKMPANFLRLGLILLLFPKARIIHCVRDPRDTSLSIYFQDLSGSHTYAYNLTHIGAYYKLYQRMMRHWTEDLAIPLLEVRYEDLVTNPETIGRRLVAYLGLEWDDHCLHFHESKRIVTTASHLQVREPIYTRSVSRWKKHEQHIAPLIDALNELS